MIRSLLVLLGVGVVGIAALGIFFSVLVPLTALAIKVILLLAVGYLILRLVRPDLADDIRDRARGTGS